MKAWFLQYGGTVCVAVVVFAVLAAVVCRIVINKRRGKSMCSCGNSCAHCGGSCHKKPPKA